MSGILFVAVESFSRLTTGVEEMNKFFERKRKRPFLAARRREKDLFLDGIRGVKK